MAGWTENPGDTPLHEADFGGFVDDEATVDGYTVPSRLRIGWYSGSERFAAEGEFFRATVDSIAYR